MNTVKLIHLYTSSNLEERRTEIVTRLSKYRHERHDDVSQYLRGGKPLLVMAGFVIDCVDSTHPIIEKGIILTDGEWAWSNELTYYVEKYNYSVPSPLLSTMQRNCWLVPEHIEVSTLRIGSD